MQMFRRDCVSCPNETPSCKSCPSGQVCQLTLQTCQSCAQATCRDIKKSSGPNAGAIVGGVVGSLAGIALVLGVLLWYKFRHRRHRRIENVMREPDFDTPPPSPGPHFTSEPKPFEENVNLAGQARREGRASSMVTSQVAASNVIPIYVGQNQVNAGGRSLYSTDQNGSTLDYAGVPAPYHIAVQGHPSLIDVTRPPGSHNRASEALSDERAYMPLYPPSRASTTEYLSNLPEEAILYHQQYSNNVNES